MTKIAPENLVPPRHDPEGILFFDNASNREMKLVTEGPWKDWIVYRHPEGQWVTLRKATQDDIAKINQLVKDHDD